MKKIIYELNKKFRTCGVHLDVQTRFELLDVKRLKHLTVKFACALFRILNWLSFKRLLLLCTS